MLKALARKNLLVAPNSPHGADHLVDGAAQAPEFRLEHLSAAGFRLRSLLDRLRLEELGDLARAFVDSPAALALWRRKCGLEIVVL